MLYTTRKEGLSLYHKDAHRHRSVSVLNASNMCRGYSLCELPLPFCCRMPLCIAEYHGRARRVLVAERPARDEERGE